MSDHLSRHKCKSSVRCPFGPQCHLSSLRLPLFTFQPPFILFPLQWPVYDTNMSIYPQARGPLGPAWPGPLTWWGGHTHEDTSVEETARSSPLDVYSDIIQHIATRDPENMSYVIPFVVYLTLLETHRQTQISTDSHTPSLLHCIMSSVFLWPLCPSPERMVGALCLNPLFGPSGERDTILLASWLHQPPVWTPFKHT